jgi:hypothetical protein
LVGPQYPCLRPRKHLGPLTWVGENPDQLVAFRGVLPIFLGLVHLAPYPVKFGILIAETFRRDEAMKTSRSENQKPATMFGHGEPGQDWGST